MFTQPKQFEILKIYLANLSVESPHTGRLPTQISQPSIEIDIQPSITQIGGRIYEVSVRVTVAARSGELTLFLVQLTQAGLFALNSTDTSQTNRLLREILPQLIFPFARNAISNSILMAGYQPLVLDHIEIENFFRTVDIQDKRLSKPAFPETAVAAQATLTPVNQVDDLPATPLQRAKAVRFQGSAKTWVKHLGAVAALLVLTALALGFVLKPEAWREWMPVTAKSEKPHLPAVVKQPPTPVQAAQEAAPPEIVEPAIPPRIDGQDVDALAKIGGDWIESQNGESFTIEWRRSSDFRVLADFPQMNSGQPFFLIKLAGTQPLEYAIVNGVYPDAQRARQAAETLGVAHQIRKIEEYR